MSGGGKKHPVRAVFLDRDGTLGGDGGGVHPDEFELYPCAPEAIRLLNAAGGNAIVVTRQSRIAKGLFTLADVERGFQRLQAELARAGAHLDAWYICPHRGTDHPCCKPNTGLLERAAADFTLELKRCCVIGDTGSADMVMATRAGCKGVLVRTGWGEGSLGVYRHTWPEVEPAHVAVDVLGAVRWVLDGEGQG